MNKRRVETATSLFLLVFYIIYIASYFFFQLSNAHRRFSDYNYQLFNEAFRLENLCESGSISVDSLEYYVDDMFRYGTDYDYISVFKMYSLREKESGELITSNGFYIEINDEKYLTSNDDQNRLKAKEEIKEAFESQYDVTVTNAEFYVRDGKRVFTSVTLEEAENGKKVNVKLSEPQGEVRMVELTSRYELDWDSVVPDEMDKYDPSYLYYYIDADTSKREFLYINPHLDTLIVGADLKDISEHFDSYLFGSDSSEWWGVDNSLCELNESELKLNEGEYVFTYYTYFNPYRSFFSFSTEFLLLNLLFIILAVAIRVVVPKLYYKNQLYEQSRSAFTAAAAHELKTPIAVIANSAECIMENVSPEKNEKYVKSIYDESLRMGRLVNSLMQFNRLSSGRTAKIRRCDLSEIALGEVEKYKSSAEEKNIVIETDICPKAKVKADSELIALVIDNYLSNAVKHTENGKAIKVSLHFNAVYDNYRLSVFNEGEQIPPEHMDKIWNVLYRADEVRNSDDNSSGMGLAISRQILQIHKCVYGAINRENGVEFYFDIKK
ncbi:MAG: hypothetical protein IJL63_06340 [Clostridia bacterium]|nr:hypothetical protein [Clostridia bacterium]